MAALPDAESSGIVSLVLKTIQLVEWWSRLGGEKCGAVEPPEVGHALEGAPWVG